MPALFILALGWLLMVIVLLGFLSLRRSLEYRARMASMVRGITPPERRRHTLPPPFLMRRTGVLQGGVMTTLGGLVLTLGLAPIGFLLPPARGGPSPLGPWLLAGVIPLAIGSAMILGQYLPPGRPGGRPPKARTDHPGGRTNSAEQHAASSHPGSE